MRTNIVIDDDLMREALKTSGLKSKRQTVEAGLRLLVKLGKQQEVQRLRGKLLWEGSLDDMRRDQ